MHGEYKVPGGKLVVADLHVNEGRLARVRISGDFFLEPPETLTAIDRALEGLPVSLDETTLARHVQRVLAPPVSTFGFDARAVAIAVRRALS